MSDYSRRTTAPLLTMVKGAGIGAIILMVLAMAIGPITAIMTAVVLYVGFFFKFGSSSVADMIPKFGGSKIDNVGFAEWRAKEIEDIERRKAALDKSEADFAAFLQEKKAIEDRKEFDLYLERRDVEKARIEN